MFMSKLKEAIICFKAGRVTLPYPFQPAPPPERYRGKLTVDVDKCIGCGGCANVCPSRLILITDVCQEKRILNYHLERCTYCARCEEVCPEKAITLTKQFETATNDINDMHIRTEIFMGVCQRCGRCFQPESALDKMMVTGFRT